MTFCHTQPTGPVHGLFNVSLLDEATDDGSNLFADPETIVGLLAEIRSDTAFWREQAEAAYCNLLWASTAPPLDGDVVQELLLSLAVVLVFHPHEQVSSTVRETIEAMATSERGLLLEVVFDADGAASWEVAELSSPAPHTLQ